MAVEPANPLTHALQTARQFGYAQFLTEGKRGYRAHPREEPNRHGMMVESVDTTDFDWSRRSGNGCRDALKFGEPSAHSVATPNQVVAPKFSVGQKA
ncbi:MAG: hypothetical protein M3Z35_06855 [Nitrospirota bacterium]|nr:hypothetical protein [Nitrospirota bacterium]